MSSQSSQRGRVNLSPSAMPSSMMRPMKAVKPFTLKGSPTRKSPACSPTPNAIGHRNSPERKSPISPSFKVEKPRAVRSNGSPSLRRTTSLEAIYNSYLSGKWPSPEVLSHFMVDQTTQTPDDWEIHQSQQKKKKRKSHGRSASFGQGDHVANAKNIHYIKSRLQKTKEGSKQNGGKQSPVPGNHQALSSTAPAALQVLRGSKPQGIPNHIPKSNSLSRYQRNSVEGLNTEIEKLVLQAKEEDLDRVCSPDTLMSILAQFPYDIPDGHKAPCPDLVNRGSSTRSVDTQTPGNLSDNSSGGSRSHSVSPAIPIIPGHMDSSRPSSDSSPRRPSSDSSPRRPSSELSPRRPSIEYNSPKEMEKVECCESPDSLQKKISSPGPNNSYLFVREPPDGCEKVKVIDEDTKSHPVIKEPLLYCPIKPSQFILKPSVDSAFCPLRKLYTPEMIKSQGTQGTQTTTSVSQ